MFVKRLELFGFKTFADRTVIEFSEGITAIVGPNGSGKSNIVDALLWVLGESNVRNLRGQRAVDVIFNGSEARRAVGMAEVSLTIDNSSRTLPLDFNEVTITRRAYRSGEGEFFINRTRCRLKDIYELFLDTGLGARGAYSIVGQGEIDAVLSARPEDRRELFEEAAGVKKYRYRREEALRKLERTETNLRRVCDIMAEIGGQLEPLAEQAEQAKRYNELQTRLWDIEVGLLIRDLKRAVASLSETRAVKRQAEDQVEQCDKELRELDSRKSQLSTMLERTEQELEDARRTVQAIAENVQRLESQKAIVAERIKASEAAASRLECELVELKSRLEQIRDRIRDLEEAEKRSAEEARALAEQVRLKTQVVADLEAELDQMLHAAEEQKASYLDLTRQIAEKRSAVDAATERIKQIETALNTKNQQLAEIEAVLRETKDRRSEAVTLLNELRRKLDETRQDIARLESERDAHRARLEELRGQAEQVSRELASQSSRLITLEEMAESHEGFFEGVRSVMAAARKGILRGEYAVVADVISVPEGLETAIETALGASLQDIITNSVDEAKKAIEFLKAEKAGRATFLPLASLRIPDRDIRGAAEGKNGLLGLASNLVGFPAKYGPAIVSLLGKVLVAESIDSALSIARQAVGWSKIVTIEGELILPSGAITGGVIRTKSAGIIARKQLIAKLQDSVKELKKRADDTTAQLAECERSVSECVSDLRAKQEAFAAEQAALSEQEKLVSLLERDISSTEKQAVSLRAEVAELNTQLEVESERLLLLKSELADVGYQDASLDQELVDAEHRLQSLRGKLTEERALLTQLKIDYAGLTERNQALSRALQDSHSTLIETEKAIADRTQQLQALTAETESMREELDSFEVELSTQRGLFEAAERRLKELTSGRADTVACAAEVDKRIRLLTAQRNEKAAEAHEAEVKIARLEVQLNQTADRLFQEYELSYEQALEWPDEDL
ncbi:MAG: chromosome segregation protein SMC, partial [Armatimonadota bacterium]|nr:chromosome segregation protein SMC [Armatimonadota bacterium]